MTGPEMGYEQFWTAWGVIAVAGGAGLLMILNKIADAVISLDKGERARDDRP